jgi:hypothetical protein
MAGFATLRRFPIRQNAYVLLRRFDVSMFDFD